MVPVLFSCSHWWASLRLATCFASKRPSKLPALHRSWAISCAILIVMLPMLDLNSKDVAWLCCIGKAAHRQCFFWRLGQSVFAKGDMRWAKVSRPFFPRDHLLSAAPTSVAKFCFGDIPVADRSGSWRLIHLIRSSNGRNPEIPRNLQGFSQKFPHWSIAGDRRRAGRCWTSCWSWGGRPCASPGHGMNQWLWWLTNDHGMNGSVNSMVYKAWRFDDDCYSWLGMGITMAITFIGWDIIPTISYKNGRYWHLLELLCPPKCKIVESLKKIHKHNPT